MASTYSSNLRLTLQATGENAGTWGDITNTNLGGLIEQAITGAATITLTGNKTLTTVNGAVDEARNAGLIFIGTLSAIAIVTCPAVSKMYVIANNTTGSYAVTVKTTSSTGTTVTIPNGATIAVMCDGTNMTSIGSLYISTLTSATTRSVADKLQERISVKDFGADPTGTVDATSAFSLCAQAGSAIPNNDISVPSTIAPVCVRYIPAGTYKLTDYVDTGNRHVIWTAQGEVRIVDAAGATANGFLNGKLSKEGQALGGYHFANRDYACGYSIRCNPGSPIAAPSIVSGTVYTIISTGTTNFTSFGAANSAPGTVFTASASGTSGSGTGTVVTNVQNTRLDAGVDGFQTTDALNTYYSRDSVGLYVSNDTPACLLSSKNTVYTATSVTITETISSNFIKKLRVGMMIDTVHDTVVGGADNGKSVNKYTGFITGWTKTTSGSIITSVTINVIEWRKSPIQTNTIGTGTPTNGILVIVNPVTKIWGQNTIVRLNPDALFADGTTSATNYATQATGYELSMYNLQSSATSSDYNVWGYDVSTLGTYTCDIAHVARGDWRYGFYYTLPSRTSSICSAGNFVVGNRYIIQSLGTTVSFTTIGASSNTVNTVFVATGTGATGIGVAQQVYGAGEFTLSYSYTIATSGASGFTAIGAANNNAGTTFLYNGSSSSSVVGYATMNPNTAAAFAYDGDGSLLLGNDSVGNQFFKVSPTGNVLMGNTNIASSTYINFYSSGNSNWDARIICNGGSSTTGQGALNLYADSLVLASSSGTNNTVIRLLSNTTYIGGDVVPTGNIVPSATNLYNLGNPSTRWNTVYVGTGGVNSSDANLKQDIAELTDAERRVAVVLKGLIRTFRFKDAVALKSDRARIHTGVIAQEVQAAFAAEGLDGFRYGLLCYDEWETKPAVLDAEGNIIESAQEAGNCYGIRYEELLAFIISAM